MKKTILLTIITLVSLYAGQAQSLSQTVVANSGATISGASNTLSFTFGEPVIGMISNGQSLGQGFWLGAIEEIVLSSEDFSLEVSATVYPNPVSNHLNITFTDMVGQDFDVTFFDIQGRAVMQQELSNSSTTETLSLDKLSTGTYLLRLTQQENQKSKTFKIIKH